MMNVARQWLTEWCMDPKGLEPAKKIGHGPGLNRQLRHKLLTEQAGVVWRANLRPADRLVTGYYGVMFHGEASFGKTFLMEWVAAHIHDALCLELKFDQVKELGKRSVRALRAFLDL